MLNFGPSTHIYSINNAINIKQFNAIVPIKLLRDHFKFETDPSDPIICRTILYHAASISFQSTTTIQIVR